MRHRAALPLSLVVLSLLTLPGRASGQEALLSDALRFSVRSAKSGPWSDASTWEPARVPRSGDRVLVSPETEVTYDMASKDVVRMVQVAGTLRFATDRSTELNVGIVKITPSTHCSESGFSCEFVPGAPAEPSKDEAHGEHGEHGDHSSHGHNAGAAAPALLIGTPDEPVPAEHSARVRLWYQEGFDQDTGPAIACCGGRMEIHGSPLSRTWVELGANVSKGADSVRLSESVHGWSVGDQVIVTGSFRSDGFGSFRPGARRHVEPETELRTIVSIDAAEDAEGVGGARLRLDRPLEFEHLGEGEFRSEVANLSRNVVIESAEPDGVRGHTVYHHGSQGSVSYARFAHLGKEGRLGRYALHFHLVGDSMRGSSVEGVAIVDSHNRWITIHGTEYLVVRDCVGYQSVGHGFFLEDGTEVYNLLERNLGVHAYRGERLPDQVLPFDQNEGAAFWWANGKNSFVRNVGVESDQYGFRYDMQHSRYFDSTLEVRQSSGERVDVDVRTIPIWRFDENEAHGSFAGMVVAANGVRQPDSPIRDDRSLERIKGIDWTGPDARHPHRIRDFTIWSAHYAFRPQSPSMLVERLRIHDAAYGIYRPAFEDHVYRDLHISQVGAEPFNRGMDDASAQVGSLTVDGLIFETGYGNGSTPLIQLTDNDLGGQAESHFRRIEVRRPDRFRDRWPLFNRGVGPRVPPVTETGVPVYVHDHFGPGRHAKVVSVSAQDLLDDGREYREVPTVTGDEARLAEVDDVPWPELLEPIDDEAPATIVLRVSRRDGKTIVRGVSHDDGDIAAVRVNHTEARVLSSRTGVVDFEAELPGDVEVVSAHAVDRAGNIESTPHSVSVP